MSTELATKSENVMSFLEASVRGQRETANTLTVMYQAMVEIKEQTEAASAKAELAVVQAREIREEVLNSVYLYPGESGQLCECVRDRSIELAKFNQVPEEKFTETVGKIRRRIWSRLKQQYGVSKYIYLPHAKFNNAIEFVRDFSLVD